MCRWAAWEWRGFAYLGCVMVPLEGIECRAFLSPSPPPATCGNAVPIISWDFFVSHNTVLRCENLGA